jgi:hypothetical protein
MHVSRLKTDLQPVGMQYHLAAEGDKKDEKDKSASNSRTGTPPPKTESPLKPIEKHIQHQ